MNPAEITLAPTMDASATVGIVPAASLLIGTGRTRQPGGVLHGGASVAFAETLASWGSTFTVDPTSFYCVGMEINANHVRPVAEGWVYGEARPISRGRTTQVWDIRITDEQGRLVCVSRCTMAVLATPSQY